MRISYFNYLWDINGISAGSAIKAKEFMAALNRAGHEVYLNWRTTQPSKEEKNNLVQNVRKGLKQRLSKYIHEPKKLAFNVKHLIEEYKIIKEQSPDIIFERNELYNFAALALAKLKKIPLVLEVDCPVHYEHNTFYGKEFMHIFGLSKFIELTNLRYADAIIIISNELKNYFVSKGIPAEKMYVIPNAADPQKFYPRNKEKSLVEKYNLEGKVVIGWIGSLYGWSGIENLVEMAKRVLEKREQVSFLFVGGGKNKDFFEEAFPSKYLNSRIFLPGTIPFEDVNKYLSCMDIVLAPYPKLNFWYPSSMKVFEYMSSGKAVVVSNVGQLNEIIKDGKDGFLFNPDNISDLIDKVLILVDDADLRKNMGEIARKEVLNKYNWDKNAKEMMSIFEMVLEKHRNGNANRLSGRRGGK